MILAKKKSEKNPSRAEECAAEALPEQNICLIDVMEILPNKFQPRKSFESNGILRLADSIRRFGILHPLTVRRINYDGFVPAGSVPYKYELISGERRLRAAMLLGLERVPCIIRFASEKESAEIAVIENLLRRDLDMFEEARAFSRLINEFSMTQQEVAERVSSAQSSVANKLRLLRLSDEEQQYILDEKLTERHARALLKISDGALRFAVLREIASKKLNVSASEQYIERIIGSDLPRIGASESEENEERGNSASETKEETNEVNERKTAAIDSAAIENSIFRLLQRGGYKSNIESMRAEENEKSIVLTVVLRK